MSEYTGKTVTDWYNKHFPPVFKLCLKILRNTHDAEDAVQDVYEKLIKKEERGKDLSEIESELGYIKKIAFNLCLDRLAARKKKYGDCFPFIEDEIPADPMDDSKNNQMKEKEMIRAILETMETESEETRLYYYYYYLDDMKLKQIAEKVGRSISWVHKKLEAFRKQARRRLEENLK